MFKDKAELIFLNQYSCQFTLNSLIKYILNYNYQISFSSV